jgi:molybdopterin-guanine dinucleotide biosynthesis protein A
LPVFQLTGGNAEQRRHFLRLLVTGLEQRSITCKTIGEDDPVNLFSLHWYAKNHDLVVVDTPVEIPLQTVKISCGGKNEKSDFTWGGDTEDIDFIDLLIDRLDAMAKDIPVWGCVLIGGRSSRMGRPKHLLENRKGTTWLESTLDILNPLVDGLVISGNGLLPGSLQSLTRLADVPRVVGPLSGVLAAGRWQPLASWLLVACDMPNVSEEAVRWLLGKRRAGCWGVAPRQVDKTFCEPLFSWYDMRAFQLMEDQVLQGNMRIGALASHPKIDNPIIPDRLRNAWQNVNTPEQLQRLLP